MVFKVILIILSSVLAVGVVVLFAPLAVRLSFSAAGLQVTGGGVVSFLHPGVLSVTIDLTGKKSRLIVLGRALGSKKKKKESTGPATDATENVSPAEEPEVLPEPPIEDLPRVEATVPEELVEVPEQPSEELPVVKTIEVTPAPDTPLAEHISPAENIEEPPAPTVPSELPPAEMAEVPETFSAGVDSMESAVQADVKPEEKVAPEAKKKDNWFTRLERNRYLFFIRNSRWRSKVLRWLVRVIRTLFHLVRFDHFQLAIRAGVHDPVLIGTFSGLYQALLNGLPLKRPYAFVYEPVFMRNCFECSGSIRVSTSLARVLTPVGVAVVTFPLVHTLWLVWCVWRRERRYRKEAVA